MRGALLGLCLFLAAPSYAQTTAATMTGVVRDQDGGLIPGAQVTVTFGRRAYRRTTAFGSITSAGDPRVVQLAVKLLF